MLELIQTATYKKNLKKYKHNKQVLQELEEVIDLLVNEKTLPLKYRNHKLTGNYVGMLELHLKPDDLLIYVKIENHSIMLISIGSHSELFC